MPPCEVSEARRLYARFYMHIRHVYATAPDRRRDAAKSARVYAQRLRGAERRVVAFYYMPSTPRFTRSHESGADVYFMFDATQQQRRRVMPFAEVMPRCRFTRSA